MICKHLSGPPHDVVAPDGGVHDPERIAYLDAHFPTAHQALSDGVDLRGYFVWSLMDNFEWSSGESSRFGLVHVDYETQRRTPKNSATWYARVPPWHPTGRQTFSVRPRIHGRRHRPARRGDTTQVRGAAAYEIHVVAEALADPDRVLARLQLVFPGYVPETAEIWCIFHFDEAGLTTGVEEMLDTASGPQFPT